MIQKRLTTSFASAAFLLVCGSAQAQVRGTVVDAGSGSPLPEVAVSDSSGGPVDYTNRAGAFSVACDGAVTLAFRKAGYSTAYRRISDCGERPRVALVSGPQVLSAVHVVGAADQPSEDKTAATTTMSTFELHRNTGLFLQDAINLTPGIYMQRRSMSGGQTIRIRGYSDGSDAGNFVGTGYKAYLNGIPITDAEGQTVLDDIDFASIGRVQVIRGPATSLYGAGIGGVVKFYTARPSETGTSLRQGVTAGQDGLLRSDTWLSRVTDASTVSVGYGSQDYDSYRIHSASKKDYVTFLGDFRPSAQQTVSTFLSYAKSHDKRAGELDSAQFAQELNTGETRYIDNDARSNVESVRAGVTQTYRHNDHVQSVATGYFSGNVGEDVFAAGINSASNQSFGARLELNTTFANAALPLRGTSGFDFQKTQAFAQGHALSNAVPGALRSDIETHNTQLSAFSEWDAALPSDFTLTAGASLNFIEYSIVDRMANTSNPNHLDGSGRKSFDPVFIPRIGLRRLFGNDISGYVNVSRGYTPPTSSDAIISFTGEPNDDLDPERATQVEIGSAGSIFDNRLTYQLSLFDLRISDKLTSQGVFDTDGTVLYTFTVNSGDQKNRGLELAAGFSLIDNPSAPISFLRPFMSYTYSDFKYSDFASNNDDDSTTVDFSGNRVVGTAKNVINFGVDAALRSGLYGNATYHRTDGMPISFDNAHSAPGFSLVSAKVGFAHEIGRFNLDAFVGGDNLGSSRYYTQVFLNHKFDSPTPPHMFLPGPYKAKFYSGLNVTVGF
jgi:iron complex outermembrane receptor protein